MAPKQENYEINREESESKQEEEYQKKYVLNHQKTATNNIITKISDLKPPKARPITPKNHEPIVQKRNYLRYKFQNILDLLTIENPGPYESADEVLKTVQLGDLIQFKRNGYDHWGIYCGGDSVIHLRNTGEKGVLPQPEPYEEQNNDDNSDETSELRDSNEINGKQQKQKEVLIGVVEMMKLSDVANGDQCRVNNRERIAERWEKRTHRYPYETFERRTPEEAVKAARMMLLTEIEYDVMHRNCEHIATKWKYNISHSDQVKQAYNAAKVAAGIAVMGGAVVVSGAGAIIEEKLDKKKKNGR